MTFVSPSKAFAHVERLVAWKHGQKTAPVTVEWDLSNRCSLGCQDCHFAHTHSKGPWAVRERRLPIAFDSTGDLADVELVKRGLGEMRRAGVSAVVWSGGGEPTLHPSWREIVSHASVTRLRQGMYTLGGHVDIDGARAIAENLDWVVVSLDAVDAETYAAEKGVSPNRFAAAVDGVRTIAQYRDYHDFTLGVSFLLHEQNWTRADEMRRFALDDLLADYATFRPTIQTRADVPSKVAGPVDWIRDAMPTLEWLATDPRVEVAPARFADYAEWNGHGYATCHAVKLNSTVTPDGRVWFCPQRRGVGEPVGDLREESFAKIVERHPGQFAVDDGCRAMCRLHAVNQQIVPLFAGYKHEAFV